MKIHTTKGGPLLKKHETAVLEGGTVIEIEGDNDRIKYLKTDGLTFINLDSGESRDYVQLSGDKEYRVVKEAQITSLK